MNKQELEVVRAVVARLDAMVARETDVVVKGRQAAREAALPRRDEAFALARMLRPLAGDGA